MKTQTILLTILLNVLFLFSCKKKENELTDRTLSNTYQNGFITIDSSVVKQFASSASIEIYFHFDHSIVSDMSEIDKVVYTRNGTDGFLNAGNYNYIYNLVPKPLSSTYDYDIALKFKNGLTSFSTHHIVNP